MVTEIRLNNFFYPISRRGKVALPNKIPFKILSINFDIEAIPFDRHPSQVEKWSKFDSSDLSPIPMSVEWLVKFGFKEYFFGCQVFDNGKFSVSLDKDGFFMSNSVYADKRIDINYVHVLQNLHFYLTNDELGIVL